MAQAQAVKIPLTTTDYLAVILDEFFEQNNELNGTPTAVHSAFRNALEKNEELPLPEIDFGPRGAPTFSHALAAGFSNLQSLTAIERANPKLVVYRRSGGDRLSDYANEARKAMGEDEKEALRTLARSIAELLA